MKAPNIKVPLWGKVFIYFIICLLGGVLVFVLHLNIVPWQKLAIATLNFLGAGEKFGFGFLNSVPGLSGMFDWITKASGYLIGVVLFLIIQLAELASKIIYRLPWILKKVLAYSNTYSGEKPKQSDKGVNRRVKKALSGAITWAIAHLENIRKGAYIIDACVCFAAYPFVKDSTGIFDFLGVIFTAQVDRIDLIALLAFGITVYGVELLVDTIWAFYDLIK